MQLEKKRRRGGKKGGEGKKKWVSEWACEWMSGWVGKKVRQEQNEGRVNGCEVLKRKQQKIISEEGVSEGDMDTSEWVKSWGWWGGIIGRKKRLIDAEKKTRKKGDTYTVGKGWVYSWEKGDNYTVKRNGIILQLKETGWRKTERVSESVSVREWGECEVRQGRNERREKWQRRQTKKSKKDKKITKMEDKEKNEENKNNKKMGWEWNWELKDSKKQWIDDPKRRGKDKQTEEIETREWRDWRVGQRQKRGWTRYWELKDLK